MHSLSAIGQQRRRMLDLELSQRHGGKGAANKPVGRSYRIYDKGRGNRAEIRGGVENYDTGLGGIMGLTKRISA